MQNLIYRWMLLIGLSHVVLGVALAFAAQSWVLEPYFQYLYASVSSTPPSAEFQHLLRIMVGLFGPTVASWGVLFSLLVHLYCQHGHGLIKPVLFAALLVWCLLDSAISAYFGLLAHAYLNAAAVLSIAVPLLFLRPRAGAGSKAN